MTLKEKLKTEFPINTEKKSNKFANKCVEIADEFALGFIGWVILKCDYQSHGVFEYQGEEYTNEELLETYKKEKGL